MKKVTVYILVALVLVTLFAACGRTTAGTVTPTATVSPVMTNTPAATLAPTHTPTATQSPSANMTDNANDLTPNTDNGLAGGAKTTTTPAV